VKAVQGDSTLSTPELEIAYEGSATEKSHAAGDATAPEKTAASIRRIVAKNPVVMTRGDGDVVTSEGAEFDAVAETSVLTGNVVMTTGTDRRATSDRADLDQRADTALLTGRVVIVQGKNELRGERLFIDRKSGQTQLTWPAGQDSGPGRIAARLYRGEPSQPAKSKAAASAPSGGAEVMSFKTDPNAPIEIDADRLDVDDTKKAAVFSGEVNAVQGDFTIRSAELHAFYKGGAGLADVTRLDTPPGGAAKQAANTELTRIVAKKDVVVTSKRGQTATGDWAEYDAKANTVLVGGNVVIAQGQNLVRGTRLVIDMTSGESTIDTAPPKATAEPAGGGWMTQAPAADAAGAPENSGRASAVFFPQQLREKNAARNAPANTPDGWSSSTDLALPAANGN
jgi:lipopolysaccharide transport protein LptA